MVIVVSRTRVKIGRRVACGGIIAVRSYKLIIILEPKICSQRQEELGKHKSFYVYANVDPRVLLVLFSTTCFY